MQLFLYLGSHMEEEVESHAAVSCTVIITVKWMCVCVWGGHIGCVFIPNFALLIVAATAAGCHGNKMQDV